MSRARCLQNYVLVSKHEDEMVNALIKNVGPDMNAFYHNKRPKGNQTIFTHLVFYYINGKTPDGLTIQPGNNTVCNIVFLFYFALMRSSAH